MKVVALQEVPALVPDGASLGIGGAWFANHPMAAIRELIRAGRDDLHAIVALGSIEADLLIAAGALRRLTFGMVTLEAFGLAPAFRAAVQGDRLEIAEISSVSLQVAVEAAARNVPFLPLPGPSGSDLVARHPDVYTTATTAYGDESFAVRAIKPDVTIVHALRCDKLGNAQFEGTFGHDPELAQAARFTIVTCEEIVSEDVIRAAPDTTRIPGFLVDAVVEAPFGAHPCSHVPRYAMDGWEILAYQRAAAAGGDTLDAYLNLLRGETEAAYRERVLGGDRGDVLRALVDSAPTLEAMFR